MRNEEDQIGYLRKYSYLNTGEKTGITGINFKDAIEKYQRKWGLKVTGKVDEETLDLMGRSRCGVADIDVEDDPDSHNRAKRFAFLGGQWGSNYLTYKIMQYSVSFSKEEVEDIVRRAFRVWESISPLRFKQTTDYTHDINIIFSEGYHGDEYPFSGPYRDLAHAFPPQYGGDAHFDDSENWSQNAGYGSSSIDLFLVAVHEFGHSLGLGHSQTRGSIMFPMYQYTNNLKPHIDDILGMKSLYGERDREIQEKTTTSTSTSTTTKSTTSATTTTTPTTTSTSTSTTTTPPTTSSTTTSTTTASLSTLDINNFRRTFCENIHIDAALYDGAGNVYFFRGIYYLRIDTHNAGYSNAIDWSQYPKLISDKLLTLSSDIDAAVYLPQLEITFCQQRDNGNRNCVTQKMGNRIYIFKGDQYFVYEGGDFEQAYFTESGLIKERFQGIPNDIDSAYTIDGSHIYFTKQNQLYSVTRNDDTESEKVDDTFPVVISDKVNILFDEIHAAMTIFNGANPKTFYFYGDAYSRVSDGGDQVDSVFPPYPRKTNTHWLMC